MRTRVLSRAAKVIAAAVVSLPVTMRKTAYAAVTLPQIQSPSLFDSGAELWQAVKGNNPYALLFALSRGADINSRDAAGRTPLVHAAESGNSRFALFMLAHGALPDGANSRFSALFLAAYNGQADLADELIKLGANINFRNDIGQTALHGAVQSGSLYLTARLIEAGAEINCADEAGMTPLMEAALTGNTALAQLLVSKGADNTARDLNGRTARELALHYGKTETAAALV